MAKGILDIGEALALKDVVEEKIMRIHDLFIVTMSSLERYQSFVNSYNLRRSNNITSIHVREVDHKFSSPPLSGVRFFTEGKLEIHGEERNRLTYEHDHLGIAFPDGGLEYLMGVYESGTDKPAYGCELFVPDKNLVLSYNHLIENPEVIRIVTSKR